MTHTPGWDGGLRWPLVALLAMLLWLAGCATVPPPPAPKLAHSTALPPRADGLLAAVEQQIAGQHGAEVSGFRLLDSNANGLRYRLAVIDGARHSLDVQYYVWFADAAGQLLMTRVIAAADRGVQVRMLFDDLNTMLRDMGSPELRDAMLARVDAHPNIEVRVFNAWRERGWLGRLGEGISDFARINRRMHNKQMVADNRTAILGGRNIGDEYMGLNPAFNFHDLDVLGVGPVARQASAVFDRYWNSSWVRRLPPPQPGADARRLTPAMIELPPAAAAHPATRAIAAGQRDWTADMLALAHTLTPGRSAVHADPPSRAEGSANRMPAAYRALMRSAQREVLISNAYVIPDAGFMADLQDLAARGVRVRILTNSLSSNDVPAVNAHYGPWRQRLLQAGVQLHELRADAAIQAAVVDTPPVKSGFVGLHVKAMVVDRQRSFIGSMNLDPRSEIFNSEMGVVVDSPVLAAQLARHLERDMGPDNSWQVVAAPEGGLHWHSSAGTLASEPARHVWQRVQNLLFKLLPASYY
ncbi:phospholipase D-like domain-containing protein [Pseudaquabacterium pictum]|uniref:Phospholipase D family protein n=1 Tax=Pseudaquabacterium pictum TaxID=2315236 RepID=A0A480APR8_9BURK|nr:phospholipase D family protein [Rubrivivax pictus]GCL62082.1 phospholipase D family protein [Rubrivivax pictus]